MGEAVPARIGRTLGKAFILLVFCALFAGVATSAYAGGTAVFSAANPAAGTAVLVKPLCVGITADDVAPILSASIKVNGVPALTSVSRPIGHWYYDEDLEDQIYVVDDPTVITMQSYKTAWTMVSGTNTIVATVVSTAGTSTYTWTFDSVSGTSITTETPAPDSALPSSPVTIAATLLSPYSTFTSTMLLDGAAVPLTYSAATKTYSYAPAAPLAAGVHTVSFTARASTGSASKTWSFKVSPPMSTTWDCLGCHTSYPAAHPLDVCSRCHDHTYAPVGGHGSETPSVAGCMQYSECHKLNHNNEASSGENFTCTGCHSAAYPNVARHTDASLAAAHLGSTPSTFCDSCHSKALVAEHAKYPSTASMKYQCTICHGAAARTQARSAVAAGGRDCSDCHATPHAAQHANATMACAGTGCHNGTDLTAVHSAIGCEGCHASARTSVVAAIAAGDKRCASCHNPVAIHGAAHEASSTYKSEVGIPNYGTNGVQVTGYVKLRCLSCHRSNLLGLHGSDYTNCAMCHAVGGPASALGGWAGSCQTGACHATTQMVDGLPVAPHPAPTRAMDHTLMGIGQQPTGMCQSCHGDPERWECGSPFGCHGGQVGPATSVDYLPPVTTASRTGDDPIVWRLSATDVGDGVVATYYSFDGAPFVLYSAADAANGITNPADASAPYAHTLRYYSVDAANHTEGIKTSDYNVTDITPPNVSFNGITLGANTFAAKSLEMIVVDPKVRGLNTGVAFIHTEVKTYKTTWGWFPYQAFYQQMNDFTYALDGTWDSTRTIAPLELYAKAKSQPGFWPTYGGTILDTGGGNAWFEIQYYARDYTGNQSALTYAKLYVDNAGPTTTTSSAGTLRWRLNASDNIAGVASTYYSFDGAPTRFTRRPTPRTALRTRSPGPTFPEPTRSRTTRWTSLGTPRRRSC